MDPADVDIGMIERSQPLTGRSVLEVGCGDGRLTERLGLRAGALIAIEPEVALIDRAKERCAHIDGVDLRVGSGEMLEFDARTFDIVIFGYSLHHQDGRKALEEATRVLKPDGPMLILEPTIESEYTQLVTPFEPDEPLRLERTLALIRSGIVDVVSEHAYVVEHDFDDREALRSHLVGQFAKGQETSVDGVMEEVLGTRMSSRPITITDEVRLFLCTPRRHHPQCAVSCRRTPARRGQPMRRR